MSVRVTAQPLTQILIQNPLVLAVLLERRGEKLDQPQVRLLA
ncbi:MAG: hypothetical protein ACO1SX_28925 [Actinomycetota bacterium]